MAELEAAISPINQKPFEPITDQTKTNMLILATDKKNLFAVGC